jgi:hypothetical protein
LFTIGDQLLRARHRAEIGADRDRAAAHFFNVRLHRVALLRVGMIIDDHVGAFRGEPLRDGLTDALAAAGDECDLACEFHRILGCGLEVLFSLTRGFPSCKLNQEISALTAKIRRGKRSVILTLSKDQTCLALWLIGRSLSS